MFGMIVVIETEEEKKDPGYEVTILTEGRHIHHLHTDTKDEAEKMLHDCIGSKGWFEVEDEHGHKLAIRRSAVVCAGYRHLE